MKNRKTKAWVFGLVMIVLGLLLPEVESMVYILAPQVTSGNPQLKLLINLLIYILLPCLVLSFIYLKQTGQKAKQFFRFHRLSWTQFGLITLITLALPFVINSVIFYSSKVFGAVTITPLMKADGSTNLAEQAKTFFFTIIAMAVMPGVCEEIFFRGALLSFMKDSKWKVPVAVLVNALLFAIFHKDPALLAYTFVLGLVFTVSVQVTGSIFASIYMHTLYNAIYVLRFALDPKKYAWVGSVSNVFVNTQDLLVSLCCAALIVAVLYRIHLDKASEHLH